MPQDNHIRPIIWCPLWEGPIKNWVTKQIKRQKWRCDKIYDFEDLIQEGYLIFMKLVAKYPRVTEPQNFMALYKTAFTNFIHDKAAYMQRKRCCHDELPHDVSELWNVLGETTNAGYLTAILAEAPEELRLALDLIAENPDSLKHQPRGPRENLNMKLRRILALEDTFDLKSALMELLFN